MYVSFYIVSRSIYNTLLTGCMREDDGR